MYLSQTRKTGLRCKSRTARQTRHQREQLSSLCEQVRTAVDNVSMTANSSSQSGEEDQGLRLAMEKGLGRVDSISLVHQWTSYKVTVVFTLEFPSFQMTQFLNSPHRLAVQIQKVQQLLQKRKQSFSVHKKQESQNRLFHFFSSKNEQ